MLKNKPTNELRRSLSWCQQQLRQYVDAKHRHVSEYQQDPHPSIRLIAKRLKTLTQLHGIPSKAKTFKTYKPIDLSAFITSKQSETYKDYIHNG